MNPIVPVVDFRALFESAPGLYLVLTPALAIAAVSDAYLQATRTRREDILARSLFEVFPDNPHDQTATGVSNLRTSLTRVLQHRAADNIAVQKYDLRRPQSEGGGFEERFWSLVNSPVLGSDGEVCYIIHRVEDVTEFVRLRQTAADQHRATEEVRAAEMEMEIFRRAQQIQEVNNQLRNELDAHRRADEERNRFFRLSGDMLCIAGFDGYFKDLNSAWEKTLGYTKAELLAIPYMEFIHPDDRLATLVVAEKVHGGNSIMDFENRYRCKDGSYRWFHWSATPVFEEKIIYAVARDLTQRKQADEALRASEERFRLLVAGMIDYAIFMLDTSGHIVTWNAGAQRLKGYQAHEIIGRHFSCFYPLEDLESGKPARELEMALTEGRSADEGWRLRKDGTRFWADVVITAVRDEAGTLRGFSKVMRDLTQRKEAEESIVRLNDDLERRVRDRTGELEKVNAQLKVLDQRKDDFVNNVSHEIRTPLSIIRESISQVSDGLFGEVPAEQKRHLDKSLVNVDRLVNIISHLLDVAKIENMKLQLYKANVNMTSLVEDVVSNFENKAKAKGLELRCEPPDRGVIACIDQEKIIQVFGNLLSNAIKFTEKGHISISIGATDDFVECKVSDTGKGIAQEDLSKLFNKFEQIGRHNGSGEEGTGLGLAISKGIIELHGGKIHVASEEGKGSIFTFTLPKYPMNECVQHHNLKSVLVPAIKKFNQFSIIQLVIATEEEQLQVQTALLHDVIVRCLYRRLDEVVQDGRTIYIVLPDTRKEDCPIVIERIKQAINVSLAVQITCYPDDGITEDELIWRLFGTKEGADENAISGR